MWVAGLIAAALQHQAPVPPDSHWRWIANDADVIVAADGHSIAATGDRRAFNLVTFHRTALADGSDILHWRLEMDCTGGEGGGARLVARERTLGRPAAGAQLPGEWDLVSDVVGAASAALCQSRLDPYRRGRPVGGDHGFETVQGMAQMARGAFMTRGRTGDWRVLGELEAAPFMVAMEESRPWNLSSYRARRLALVGPEPIGQAAVTLTTALVDCGHRAVTLVDSHGLDGDGRRLEGVTMASSYFSIDTASFRRNDAEAELSQSIYTIVCENESPGEDDVRFDDVATFARISRDYLNR